MGEAVSFSLSTSSNPEAGFAGATMSHPSLHLCGQRVLKDGDKEVSRVEFHAGGDGKQLTVSSEGCWGGGLQSHKGTWLWGVRRGREKRPIRIPWKDGKGAKEGESEGDEEKEGKRPLLAQTHIQNFNSPLQSVGPFQPFLCPYSGIIIELITRSQQEENVLFCLGFGTIEPSLAWIVSSLGTACYISERSTFFLSLDLEHSQKQNITYWQESAQEEN